MLFNTVNQHCLNSISKLAETHEVIAADDIVDDRGNKLWAQGNRVSDDLTEKLLRRKLAKPLEASLTVEGAVTMADIVQACHAHLEQNPLLGRVAGSEALKLLDQFRNFPLPEPMRLLLTSVRHSETITYKHTLGTLLISAGIASLLHASEHDARIILLATLLHDLGELYINPDYLNNTHRLMPHEWKHVASHPRISQLLVEELTMLPSSIGQCISHHHERLDGSGYPMQIDRHRHHPLANWLAIADTVTPILTDGDCGAPLRAALALRVVPEEFDSSAAAAVIQALRKGEPCLQDTMRCTTSTTAQSTWRRLAHSITLAKELCQTTNHAFVRKTAESALSLLSALNKSLRSTGVTELGPLNAGEEDAELILEICQVEKELVWRMRNLARNIHLRADQQAEESGLAALAPLIAALDLAEDAASA